MRLPRIARLRPVLSLLLGGWLLVLVAELTPHLVHHLFDPDEDGQCLYLAAADHAPPAVATAVVTLATPPACDRAAPPPATLPGSPVAPSAATRGPPIASRARA